MDPAEDFVSLWLQGQGFFIMSDVKVGYRGKEIDFLGINPQTGKKVHVEVHASVFPVGPLRAWGPAKYGKKPASERVRHYHDDKFVGSTVEGTGELLNTAVSDKAEAKLGKDYEKWLVLGALHKKDSEEELRKEFQDLGVKIFFMRDVLGQLRFKGAARDSIGRFVQLLASQLTPEARQNLLER